MVSPKFLTHACKTTYLICTFKKYPFLETWIFFFIFLATRYKGFELHCREPGKNSSWLFPNFTTVATQITPCSCKIHVMSMIVFDISCPWRMNVYAFDPIKMAYVHKVKTWFHANEFYDSWLCSYPVYACSYPWSSMTWAWTGHELCMRLLWLFA